MAMRACVTIFFAMLISSSFLVGDAASGDKSGEGDWCGKMLPDWRLYTEVIRYTEPSIGVYRRISEKWDFGMQFTGRISTEDDDAEREGTREDDSSTDTGFYRDETDEYDQFYLSVRSEARRWTRPAKRLSIFHGARFTYTHNRRTRDGLTVRTEEPDVLNSQSTHVYTNETTSDEIAFSPVMGVDVHLVKYLSAVVSMVPVSFGMAWRDYEDTRIDHYTSDVLDREDVDRRIGESTDRYVDWGFSSRVYLSVNW